MTFEDLDFKGLALGESTEQALSFRLELILPGEPKVRQRRDGRLRRRELVQVLVLQRGLLGLRRRLRKARFRRRGARLRGRELLAQELLGLRPRGRRRI